MECWRGYVAGIPLERSQFRFWRLSQLGCERGGRRRCEARILLQFLREVVFSSFEKFCKVFCEGSEDWKKNLPSVISHQSINNFSRVTENFWSFFWSSAGVFSGPVVEKFLQKLLRRGESLEGETPSPKTIPRTAIKPGYFAGFPVRSSFQSLLFGVCLPSANGDNS